MQSTIDAKSAYTLEKGLLVFALFGCFALVYKPRDLTSWLAISSTPISADVAGRRSECCSVDGSGTRC